MYTIIDNLGLFAYDRLCIMLLLRFVVFFVLFWVLLILLVVWVL